MKGWRSVRFKLALWYLAVLALGMATFGASSWFVLRQVMIENRLAEMDRHLGALEIFLAKESRGDDLPALSEEAREYSISLTEGQGIKVVSAAGQILFDKKAASGSALQRIRRISIRGHAIDIALAFPSADIDRILRTLAWIMVLVFPAVLIFALAGGWWMAKRSLQPVGEMTREARNISAHDLAARLSVPATGDELQDLAVAWNQLLARIEAAVGAVKRFTADAAHELRTPVTVVRTAAELALRHPRSAESYRQTLTSIEQETVQMTGLLDQLLLLARGDAGEWKFRFDTVFADQILRGLRHGLLPLAESKQIRMDWEIPAGSAMIWADETAIRRLVLILVDNAITHTPAGGTVSVSLHTGDGECALAVTDTGVGIAPEHLPNIFDRFYRADPARSPGSGAGLGLAIARAIVDAHNGTIEVASTGGQGTRFRVSLPSSESPAVTPSTLLSEKPVEKRLPLATDSRG
ncbi:MAG: ATP-binding protein [Acidobacteriota bacterium]